MRDERSTKLNGCDARTRAGHPGVLVAAAAVVVVVARAGESLSIACICTLRHTGQGFDKEKNE